MRWKGLCPEMNKCRIDNYYACVHVQRAKNQKSATVNVSLFLKK